MEHRQSERFGGELPILLYKRGMPVATGSVRNASRRGLFIATDYSDVRINQALRLGFRLAGDRSGRHYSLKTHVVRVDGDGLGVDFEGVNDEAQAIADLVIWFQAQGSELKTSLKTKHYAH